MAKNKGKGKRVGDVVEAVVVDGASAAVAEYVESGDEGRALARGIVTMVRTGTKEAGSGIVRLITDTPDRRLAAAVEEDFDRDLEEVAPELEEKLQDLVDDPKADTRNLSSSAATVANKVLHAYARTPDARKKRILMAALVNAFDKEAYEEGLTVQLLKILDELDYPEIRMLGEWKRREGRSSSRWVLEPGALDRAHTTRLVEAGLLLVHHEHGLAAEQLRGSERLAASGRVTDLGVRLLRLVESGLHED